jgi:formyltetrahydrofolate-dependent phosphoribosylglycinamide formyltransferase
MSPRARLVVLISGNGSNLQAILDSCQQGLLNAKVSSVFSNKPEAYGLERARQANIPAILFPKSKEQDRRVYDAALANAVLQYQPDWVILAGWMRLLSNEFLRSFPNRVINLHPALPGCFPGTHAIERAFAAFQQGQINHTGVMVHLVPDEGVDNGPVLDTVTIPIHPQDTLETLEERVHAAEHVLLIHVLQTLTTPKGL